MTRFRRRQTGGCKISCRGAHQSDGGRLRPDPQRRAPTGTGAAIQLMGDDKAAGSPAEP